MQIKVEPGRDTFEWVLIAKGIGIILVVVGHFRPESSPTYWSEIVKIIYSFHMPLFFVLSGYLYSHGKHSYSDLIKSKTKRLLYPFVSIATAIFLIKYIAGRVVNLELPVNIDSIYALLARPFNSYMPVLWFVHALFLIFAIYPLARLVLNNLAMLLLLVVINSVIGREYFMFGMAIDSMPFFVLGVILRENGKLSGMAISADLRYAVASSVIFLCAYTMRLSVNFEYVYGYPYRILIGAAGSLLVINMSYTISALSDNRIKDVLIQIGYYSMTIYLFHTLVGSIVRIGFLQAFKHMQAPFELIAFGTITCGVILPLLLEKKVLRKNWVTKKFVLGLA